MKYFLMNMHIAIRAETQKEADKIAETIKKKVGDALVPIMDLGVYEMFAGEPFEDID